MFLPRRTVTFLQFTRKVFNAVSFGCEQHDEVIQQISSFINQAFVRTVASLNDGFHSLFAYLLCHFVDTGLEKTGRIGTFGQFIITLTDEILKKL